MAQIKTDSDGRVTVVNYTKTPLPGFVMVGEIPEPESIEGKMPEMYYRDGRIAYEYVDIPPVPEPEPIPEPQPTYEEQVVSLIRGRYTVDEELAILRQRDTKPDEFREYYEYAEGCKAQVKAKSNQY